LTIISPRRKSLKRVKTLRKRGLALEVTTHVIEGDIDRQGLTAEIESININHLLEDTEMMTVQIQENVIVIGKGQGQMRDTGGITDLGLDLKKTAEGGENRLRDKCLLSLETFTKGE